jgi:hypothetical protein
MRTFGNDHHQPSAAEDTTISSDDHQKEEDDEAGDVDNEGNDGDDGDYEAGDSEGGTTNDDRKKTSAAGRKTEAGKNDDGHFLTPLRTTPTTGYGANVRQNNRDRSFSEWFWAHVDRAVETYANGEYLWVWIYI